MQLMIVPRKVFVRTALVLCIALISIAYVRVMVMPDYVETLAPAKRPLPIYNVAMEEKVVAISFDAAWGDDKTEEILKIMAERDVKTTFFLVGYWVDKYPDDVRMIYEAGHEIGNHSATHPHMSQLSEEQIIKELKDCSDKVKAVIGVPTTLFRPPYGDYNDRLITTAKEQGYETIQWNVDSLDWKNLGTQNMINQVVKNLTPGSIILFHNNSEYITQALPAILDQILAQGYKIVPISEIILDGETYIDHAGCQHPVAQ